MEKHTEADELAELICKSGRFSIYWQRVFISLLDLNKEELSEIIAIAAMMQSFNKR